MRFKGGQQPRPRTRAVGRRLFLGLFGGDVRRGGEGRLFDGLNFLEGRGGGEVDGWLVGHDWLWKGERKLDL